MLFCVTGEAERDLNDGQRWAYSVSVSYLSEGALRLM